MLALRNEVEARVLRLPGTLYEKKENNRISNVFTYKLINKTSREIEDVSFRLRKVEGEIKLVSATGELSVPEQGLAEGTLFIEVPQNQLKGDKNKFIIEVWSGEEMIETTTINFLGPRSYN